MTIAGNIRLSTLPGGLLLLLGRRPKVLIQLQRNAKYLCLARLVSHTLWMGMAVWWTKKSGLTKGWKLHRKCLLTPWLSCALELGIGKVK